MMKQELRAIGTEFWYEYPPDLTSTNSDFTAIKYRVVEHVKVGRFSGDKIGELAESWEPLEIKRLLKEVEE